MHRRFSHHDGLALFVAALVVWAFVQLSTPWPIPLWLSLGLGVLAAAGLGAWHLASRPATGPAPPPPPALEPSRTGARWILAGIVVVALALRLHTLLDRPAWDDEMWTLRNMYTSSWGELLRVAFDDYWPPLHYLVLNAVARVADTSILWLRLPSAVFGAATVAVMYPLGRLLLGSRFQALFGAGLLAGMTSHVLYSMEARVYAMQLLLVIPTAYWFYRSYWERRVSGWFLLFGSLLTYSHSFVSWYWISATSAYVVVAFAVWRDGEALKKGVLSQVLLLLLWLPLVGAFLHSRFAREIVVPTYWATAPERAPGLVDFVEQYQGLAVRSWAGAALLALLFALALVVARHRSGAAGTGADPDAAADDPSTRRRDPRRVVVFLLCWLVVPTLFSLAVTVGTSMNTFRVIRYHLPILPGMCLLAALGVRAVRGAPARTGLAALLVLLPTAELPRFYRSFDHPPFDRAVELVRREGSPSDQFFVGNGFRVFAYYFRGAFPRIGSEEWHALAARTAGLVDRYSMESVKWGDTYAYEKIPPSIWYFAYYGRDSRRWPDRFVEEHLAAGRFDGPYWVIWSGPAQGRRLLEAMERHGVPCRGERVHRLEEIEMRHCNAPGPADVTGPP